MTVTLIRIMTTELEEMTSFYRDVLGLDVESHYKDSVSFSSGIEIAQCDKKSHVDLFFETYSLSTILKNIENPAISRGKNGERVLVTEDPDGNNVVISECISYQTKSDKRSVARII